MSNLKTVTLEGGNGDPKVSVFIGQAQYGEYTVKLKDPSTGTREVQKEGDNVDDEPDTFSLKVKLVNLDGRVLSWWITIAAPTGNAGEIYFARVSITQKDKVVPGGSFEYKGQLNNTENIIDVVKLEVA